MGKIRYVIDTVGLVSFYWDVFKSIPEIEEPPMISDNVKSIIQTALNTSESDVLMTVPSIVFIEIYEKWLRSEEFQAKFFYDVYTQLSRSPNVEIRSMDQEILENLLKVDGCLYKHELHDKIIVASAMTLECSIITFDEKIIEFVKDTSKKIPMVYN